MLSHFGWVLKLNGNFPTRVRCPSWHPNLKSVFPNHPRLHLIGWEHLISEPINDTKPDQPIRNDPAVPPSPGALLRAAREAQGLHIGALAVALKVPVKKLEALETDRFDLLPDTVFARALALSVCRTLKIDASPIMLGLPQLQTPQMKNDESGLNTSCLLYTSRCV